MKVEVTKRDTIKPFSPTPQHLKHFKLSLLDQIAPLAYTPFVLFYPLADDGNGDGGHIVKSTKKSEILKRSLSETLAHFFPLAGRVKDNTFIDCNDEGVGYFEAHVDCLLEDIIGKLETEAMKRLVPVDDKSAEAGKGCPLLVQINFFKCGGIAIGMSFSHKLSDAATFNTFIKAWSATALESGESVLPVFSAASLFPSKDISLTMPAYHSTPSKCITKRLHFNASNLACLKAKAASASVPQPTRVEVVSAFIWKCAIMASRSRSNSGGSIRPSVLGQGVNLRKRIVPPLPESSFGNLVGYFAAKTEESKIELQSLVGQLRQGMTDFTNNYAPKLVGENGVEMICESFKQSAIMVLKDDVDFYTFTSWCRLHLYEGDFGWGKPAWVGLAVSPYKNLVIFMDTKDGDGIEAYVSLSEEEMSLFESDPELLAFASAFNMGSG